MKTPADLVSDEQLKNLLCSALEGGSNYWIGKVKYVYGPGFEKRDMGVRYLELPFHEGSGIEITDDFDDHETKLLTRDALRKGLNVVFEKYDHHFKNIISEQDDAETGDVVLQCALFGDIIYG